MTLSPFDLHEAIRDDLLAYVETAFKTRYAVLNEERRQLLIQQRSLAQTLYLEPMVGYEASVPLEDALEQAGVPAEQRPVVLNFLRAGLISGDRLLYAHQAEMLKHGFQGKHCVVTTGTGSGKTEAFLLPLLARLVFEAQTWKLRTEATELEVVGKRRHSGGHETS